MFNLKEFMAVLEEIAPLELSKKMIELGDYDNSGIIVKHHDIVEKALFSLDLTEQAVEVAVKNGCDTIVTHHPAIYAPVKELAFDGDTKALLNATASGLNVISMHLNLDIAESGIDAYLAKGLGVENARVLGLISGNCGYGREGKVEQINLNEFIDKIKAEFGSDKIFGYGNGVVEKVSSFCGSGASHADKFIKSGLTDADTVVTSDIPHHLLLSLIEKGKKVVIIPHYVSEQYGFNQFYNSVRQKTQGRMQNCYYLDQRFI